MVLFAALFAVLTRETMDPGLNFYFLILNFKVLTYLLTYSLFWYIFLGLVGLTLSYALTVTQSLSYLVTSVSEAETNMVGVERIKVWTGFFKKLFFTKKILFCLHIFTEFVSNFCTRNIKKSKRRHHWKCRVKIHLLNGLNMELSILKSIKHGTVKGLT